MAIALQGCKMKTTVRIGSMALTHTKTFDLLKDHSAYNWGSNTSKG